MLSKKAKIIGSVILCVLAVVLSVHIGMGVQKELEPELTGNLSFDASYRAEKIDSIQNIMLTIGDGGTGPYKSVLVGDPNLPTHTIYRPRDLSPFGKKNLLPIVTWANGACKNSSAGYRNLLSEIASHGFIVLAIGPAASSATGGSQGETKASQLLDAVDWATAENARTDSPYYQKIDTGKVAVMGMSCGGLQALLASSDPRVTTSVIWNSGIWVKEPPSAAQSGIPSVDVTKDDLQKIHGSIAYITGTEDIALENNTDDFNRINQAPILWACKKGAVHSDPTYREPNAGDYGVYGSAWLKWQLKGDKEAAKVFTSEKCGICTDTKWIIKKKNIK